MFCFSVMESSFCFVNVEFITVPAASLLYPSQYGFRKGHSTKHAILDIINNIQANINQRLLSCGVFIDL